MEGWDPSSIGHGARVYDERKNVKMAIGVGR
jgi:hypothetical protein